MNNITLFISNASGSFSKLEPIIRSALEKAVAIAVDKISLKDVDVICIDDPSMVIPEIGIGGYTPSRHLMFLYIDSQSDKVTEQEIINTLCHEFYHSMSYDGPGYGKTLFDSMIFEGLATAFEEESAKGNSFLVRNLRSREASQALFAKHSNELDAEDFNHFKWFIYDETNELPRWAGYEIGFYIVRAYLEETNKKASEVILEDLNVIKSFADDALRGETVG